MAAAVVAVAVLWDRLCLSSPPNRPHETPRTTIERPPSVQPVELLEITPDKARAINAAIPFSKAPLARARPMSFEPSDPGYDRARDCLASAAWYEAGDDPEGERSVIQVVLNRFTHPAFPKTICEVVFQGQERTTGCQFTFTCDGALVRRSPSDQAWRRAQAIADEALRGRVDPAVGLATHYHTDWVVPNWSSSLDKIARVGTHLFFRFRGFWGQRAAMRRPSAVPEPSFSKLAGLSPAHAADGGDVFAMPKPTDADILALVDRMQKQAANHQLGTPPPSRRLSGGDPGLKGNSLAVSDPGKGMFGLTLDLNRAPGSYPLVARALCGDRTRCTVFGWRRGSSPASMAEFWAKRGSALFSYQFVGKAQEKSLWDCREMPREPEQCMPGTAPSEANSAD
jgi:spore germination cell wall hydrolase CwlJ-like protein